MSDFHFVQLSSQALLLNDVITSLNISEQHLFRSTCEPKGIVEGSGMRFFNIVAVLRKCHNFQSIQLPSSQLRNRRWTKSFTPAPLSRRGKLPAETALIAASVFRATAHSTCIPEGSEHPPSSLRQATMKSKSHTMATNALGLCKGCVSNSIIPSGQAVRSTPPVQCWPMIRCSWNSESSGNIVPSIGPESPSLFQFQRATT